MNKPRYINGDRVQIALDGNVNNIINGKIVGISSEHVIDIWLVHLDKKLDNYEYDVIPMPHTMIRLLGDNKPFLCEIGKFTYEDFEMAANG